LLDTLQHNLLDRRPGIDRAHVAVPPGAGRQATHTTCSGSRGSGRQCARPHRPQRRACPSSAATSSGESTRAPGNAPSTSPTVTPSPFTAEGGSEEARKRQSPESPPERGEEG